MEVTDEPSILVADTCAYIVAPQTRLKVDCVNCTVLIVQLKAAITAGLVPLQIVLSSM